jgi:hypothetical protein
MKQVKINVEFYVEVADTVEVDDLYADISRLGHVEFWNHAGPVAGKLYGWETTDAEVVENPTAAAEPPTS